MMFRAEPKTLTPETRAALPGSYIQLSDGFTQYELAGPQDGEVCVLVHGFSVPYFLWDKTFDYLIGQGYRVLRYNLFGRGFSDRPHVQNDVDLFDCQLLELLDALKITDPVNLFGLSMGGVVTSNFVQRHPERVKRLVLIDPAGFPPKNERLLKLVLWPPLGELIFYAGAGLMLKPMAVSMFGKNAVDDFVERYLPQMEYQGFRRSLLSTLRSGILGNNLPIYQQVGEVKLPVLLIWGEEDETVPFIHSEKLVEAIPQAQFHPIPGAGHVPQHEQPDVVNPLIRDFLTT